MNAQQVSAVVGAVSAVPGVVAAEIRPDRRVDGLGTLHVAYQDGADRLAVADAVDRLLRRQFRLTVDPARLAAANGMTRSKLTPVVEFPRTEPAPGPAPAPDPVRAPAPDPAPAPALDPTPTPGPVPGLIPAPVAAPIAVPAPPRRIPELRPEPGPHGAEPREPGSQEPQPEPEGQPAARPDRPNRCRRLLIERVQLETAGLTVRATVTLTDRGRAHVGQANGSTAPTGINRSVATATLAAVEAAISAQAAFDVDQLDLVIRGGERAVLTVVMMTTAGGSQALAGAAVVREDVHQAVMRATLDAVNRRIEPLLAS